MLDLTTPQWLTKAGTTLDVEGVSNYPDETDGSVNKLGRKSGSTIGQASVGIGKDVDAAGSYTVAIGGDSVATKTDDIAIGDEANANGGPAIAIGSGASAQANGAIALGRSANAPGNYSIAIGNEAAIDRPVGEYGIAIGSNSTSDAFDIAIGVEAGNNNGSGAHNVAIGYQASALNDKSYVIAIGDKAKADTNAIALGTNANAAAQNAIAISGSAAGMYGISMLGAANAPYSIVLGNEANVESVAQHAIAIGTGTYTAATEGITIGKEASTGTNATDSIAIGASTSVMAANSIAIGNSAVAGASATDSVVIGTNANAAPKECVVIGKNAKTEAVFYGIAIGSGATCDGTVAIGHGATSSAKGVALGESANATSNNIAVGNNANATSTGTRRVIQLGDNDYDYELNVGKALNIAHNSYTVSSDTALAQISVVNLDRSINITVPASVNAAFYPLRVLRVFFSVSYFDNGQKSATALVDICVLSSKIIGANLMSADNDFLALFQQATFENNVVTLTLTTDVMRDVHIYSATYNDGSSQWQIVDGPTFHNN